MMELSSQRNVQIRAGVIKILTKEIQYNMLHKEQ